MAIPVRDNSLYLGNPSVECHRIPHSLSVRRPFFVANLFSASDYLPGPSPDLGLGPAFASKSSLNPSRSRLGRGTACEIGAAPAVSAFGALLPVGKVDALELTWTWQHPHANSCLDECLAKNGGRGSAK